MLRGVFVGAESGFSPNQVAGALLFVAPLAVAFTLFPPPGQRKKLGWWLTLLAALIMTVVLVLTQSRGGLIGLVLGLFVMLLLPWRWGRRLLVAGLVLLVLTVPLWINGLLSVVGGVALPDQAEGLTTLSSRTEIWMRALYGIQDFSFTGMGLGTFRVIVHLLYPLFTFPPDTDIAHAHNFFLQSALDFGLPGLVALLAIYGAAIVQVVQLWNKVVHTRTSATFVGRPWAIGFAGVLVAQSVYSQFDAVALGSRPGFLLWYCLALIFGLANFATERQLQGGQPIAVAATPPPVSQPQPIPVLDQSHRPRPRRRWVGLFAGIVLLVIVGAVLLLGGRIARDAWLTYRSAQQVAAVLRARGEPDALSRARTELGALTQNLDGLAQALAPVAPILSWLRVAPAYGPVVAAAPELVAVGREAVALASEGVETLLAHASPSAAVDAGTLAVALGPQLPNWAPRLQVLQAQIDALPIEALARLSGGQAAAAPAAAALAVAGAQLGPHLPWLLGMDAPRTYLVLVQNNDELRATGGFISAVGRVTIDQGKVTELDFADSYKFYHEGGAYPWAPQAMQEYMKVYLMVLRDANWSPHFPTAARTARVLYERETGVPVDGVIAIDQQAVLHLLGAVEPLSVPGAETPITSANFEEQVIQFWDQPLPAGGEDAAADSNTAQDWFARRKDFIPAIAAVALEKLRTGAFDFGAALRGLQTALSDRSIQVWVNNPAAQAALVQAGWAGDLRPEPGADYLAVVDTNMGYNKVDAVMARSLDYAVSWPNGPDQAGHCCANACLYPHAACR